METKKLLSLALGAMLLCPVMNAVSPKDIGTEALKNPGKAIAVVPGELVGVVILSYGVKGFVSGTKTAVPATLKIIWKNCKSIVGKDTMTTEEYERQRLNLKDGIVEMLVGAGLIGGSVMEMKWCASFLVPDKKDGM